MKIGAAATLEDGLVQALRGLLRLTGARAAALALVPGRGVPASVVTAGRSSPALDRWLRDLLAVPVPRPKLGSPPTAPPGWKGPGRPVLLPLPLGPSARPLGRLLLLAGSGHRGRVQRALTPAILSELGLAVERLWRLHQRMVRLSVMSETMSLAASTLALDEVYQAFASAVARVVDFDSLAVTLIDRKRQEFRVVDVTARSVPGPVTDTRLPPSETLVRWVAEHRVSRRVDDLADPSVPSWSRETLPARGYRSAVVVPLFSGNLVIGTLNLCHRDLRAFGDEDVEILEEVARPLAAAIEQRRLLRETRQREEELGALYRTSQLITSRLYLPAVLEAISRLVTELTGGTGCGIGLLDAEKTRVSHVATHGFRTDEWRSLTVAVGDGIIGRVAATGLPILTDDIRTDPRSAPQDVDEQEGIRSMLTVPLRMGEDIIGVISASSTGVGAFTPRHQTVLEAFADQAAIAIQQAQLFEERLRWGKQMEALNEAGRVVNRSLDPNDTIRVILEQARDVLGAESCGLMALDPEKGELFSVGSLDLSPEVLGQIRLRVGEGITGLAVLLRRPVQSADLRNDPRVRFRQLPGESGLRSMLAVPLLVGDKAIGAITVFRKDIHHFSENEENLLSAFANQAAMAMEHARLFSSVRTYAEEFDVMVEDRTRVLDREKRLVEMILETLPLGLYVLDRELWVITVNRAGAQLLPGRPGVGHSFLALIPEATRARVGEFLRAVFAARQVRRVEEEMVLDGHARRFRFTAAPLEAEGEQVVHVLLLVEDITRPPAQ
ncbi:MAG: GAF domain-containing protein [Candidatus Rokubacteria bacterium]|nr:GAF domain-containing protein [Candidatus Rokubacteria bacterium]